MARKDIQLSDTTESSFRSVDLKLFVRDVQDPRGHKHPITVRSWSSIKDIKEIVQRTMHKSVSAQRLYYGPLMTSGRELQDHQTLHDSGIRRSGETLLLDTLEMKRRVANDITISSSVLGFAHDRLRNLVYQARRALARGCKPELVLDGSGGTYFLHDSRKAKIAVFKPADEEPFAENNPRGFLPQPDEIMFLRDGVVPGEACIREVAAFMLDHSGFSDVPMTTLVEAQHPTFNTSGSQLNVSQGGASIGMHSISGPPSRTMVKKVGSFQEFVRTECSMDDISPSLISAQEVHKIAILDMRLMNADRNAANLLCRRRSDNSIQLIPIDHGFCLRPSADVSWMDWCWLDWPQLKEPVNEETRKYILDLDIESDVRLLQERLSICGEAIEYFRASSSILKAGIKAGLTLYDISTLCCRNDNLGEIPSKLEGLISLAADLAVSAIENGRWHHSAASRALADQLMPSKGNPLSSSPGTVRMRKSSSAIDISQYISGLEGLILPANADPVPGMIQSSASESSSDTGDGDREERDAWAAGALKGSLAKNLSLFVRKERKHSIESEGSIESSEGFWHTSPSIDLNEGDDESWGSIDSDDELSVNSSVLRPDHQAHRRYVPSAYNPFDRIVKDSLKTTAFIPPRKPSQVKFKTSSEAGDSQADGRFKHSNSDVSSDFSGATAPTQRRDTIGLKRSQSYSGLSTSPIVSQEDAVGSQLPRAEDQEQYKYYYCSFVDLVIDQETKAVVQQKTAQKIIH